MTAGLGLRGRAGDTTLGGGGRGSRHDSSTVTLETPGHRLSASGQLDSGAPPPGRCGPGATAVAVTVPAGPRSTSGQATREPSGFFGLKDRGSVAHLPSLDSGVPPCPRTGGDHCREPAGQPGPASHTNPCRIHTRSVGAKCERGDAAGPPASSQGRTQDPSLPS